MEHAKKMILVDPRILQSRQEASVPPVPDATSASLREMDQQMRSILDRDDLNTADKANLYQQTLRRYRHRFEQYTNKPLGTVTISKDDLLPSQTSTWGKIEKDVVESLPKTMKNKAERLMHHLQNHPDVKWNDRGELVFHDQVIKHSNIVDLVHDVIRKRRRPEPLGWKTFAKALSEVNVPHELVGNPERWNFMRSQISSPTPTPSPQSVQETPKRALVPSRKNVALSSIQKLKRRVDDPGSDEGEEKREEKDESSLMEPSTTPLVWKTTGVSKKRKAHRKQRKEQRRSKSHLDWETI